MALYAYLLPLVGLAPPEGFRLSFGLPLARLAPLLDRPDATVSLAMRVYRDGAVIAEHGGSFAFRERRCADHWAVELDGTALANGWRDGRSLAYWETHVTAEPPARFITSEINFDYAVFHGAGRKTFFSDNAVKYGDIVVIFQIRAFGQWVAGYPAAVHDPSRDATESVVLINPFVRPAVVTIEAQGLPRTHKARVQPLSGQRVPLASLAEGRAEPWCGQVFVTGTNRLVTCFAKHSIAEPLDITTIEHPDVYRGEETFEPLTQRLRRVVGERLLGRR
jgi:hypothetical protein